MNSGYGVAEAAEFLKKEAQASPLTLLTPMKPGNPPEGVVVYLWKTPGIRVVPVPWWPKTPRLIPSEPTFPRYVHNYMKQPVGRERTDALTNVYFIYPFTEYPQARFHSENPEMKKVWSHPKPNPNFKVEIFQAHPISSPRS